MTHNLEVTVFVYRHRETREIRALYIDDARAMTGRADYEHIATLEPRMWIEAHYDDAEKEREMCAQVCEARYMGDNNREDMEARRCAAAIRARGQQ